MKTGNQACQGIGFPPAFLEHDNPGFPFLKKKNFRFGEHDGNKKLMMQFTICHNIESRIFRNHKNR